MTLFGFRHRTLRDLGHDWQIVETTGRNDPPDLAVAATRLTETTGAPVLAAYVSDADCALLLVAVPNGVPSVAHLPDVTRGCETTYVHRPAPEARTADGVVKDVVEWAEAGGLSPSPDDIAGVVGPSGGASRLYVQDLVFDLVRAVGLNRIGDPRRHAFLIERYPFSSIATGLGQMAAHRAGYRAELIARGMEHDEAEPWEAEAIALEEELWAALYDDDADVIDLVRRAKRVQAAWEATHSTAEDD
jgi:hypothetical protein